MSCGLVPEYKGDMLLSLRLILSSWEGFQHTTDVDFHYQQSDIYVMYLK